MSFTGKEMEEMVKALKKPYKDIELFIRNNKEDFVGAGKIEGTYFNSEGILIVFSNGDNKYSNEIPWEEYLKYLNEKLKE